MNVIETSLSNAGLVSLIPLFPLVGFIFLGLFGKKIKNETLIGAIGSATVGASLLVSIILFFDLLSTGAKGSEIVTLYTWIATGNFSVDVAYLVDTLSITFALVVTGVGFLIHIYSIGYMHGDRSFYRFFAYLNLFIFMMLNLVLSANYLLTFLGWEGVGLASYLLIGFWYDRKFDGTNIKWTGDAANKAFIVNRIGDFGFIIAMFLIFITFKSLDYTEVSQSAFFNTSMYFDTALITIITLLLFLGCTGKSAQIPLAVWLPDAMAGPTPVSALIHAATMVTAGIFLIARNSVLFALSPDTMMVVAVVGAVTAFWAATIGLVQNDIKKVLAYSTVSQLGFMFVALGVGAFYIGVFHVMTHAFFKGLLFLAAGSVIHGMHEEQDIKKMGGLKKYMPTTYRTFWVGTMAIAGIPLFAGFFSKDEILWYAYSSPLGGWGLWLVLAVAALFTAFYMFRLLFLTFQGRERFDHHKVHPHESPKTMLFALVVLAFLSAFGGFLNIPYPLGFWFSEHPDLLNQWLAPIFAPAMSVMGKSGAHYLKPEMFILMVVATVVAIAMYFLVKKWYSDESWAYPRKIATTMAVPFKVLWNKYYVDEMYWQTLITPIFKLSESGLWKFFDVGVVDGIVNGSGKVVQIAGEGARRIQSGIAQNYAILMVAGILALFIWIVIL